MIFINVYLDLSIRLYNFFVCQAHYKEVSRDPYRTPMIWSSAPGGNFTTSVEPWLPLGELGINVEVSANGFFYWCCSKHKHHLSTQGILTRVWHLRNNLGHFVSAFCPAFSHHVDGKRRQIVVHWLHPRWHGN